MGFGFITGFIGLFHLQIFDMCLMPRETSQMYIVIVVIVLTFLNTSALITKQGLEIVDFM